MGQGIDLARDDSPIHAQILDDFKDQLLIAMVRRCSKPSGRVSIPVSELDETGNYNLSFSINDGVFNFELKKKQ